MWGRERLLAEDWWFLFFAVLRVEGAEGKGGSGEGKGDERERRTGEREKWGRGERMSGEDCGAEGGDSEGLLGSRGRRQGSLWLVACGASAAAPRNCPSAGSQVARSGSK